MIFEINTKLMIETPPVDELYVPPKEALLVILVVTE
jgi:hypothetical protein